MIILNKIYKTQSIRTTYWSRVWKLNNINTINITHGKRNQNLTIKCGHPTTKKYFFRTSIVQKRYYGNRD
jgi:hypothetical protein